MPAKQVKAKKDESAGTAGARGASAMQPAASAVEGVKLVKGEVGGVRVNDPEWVRRGPRGVSVDEVWFYWDLRCNDTDAR